MPTKANNRRNALNNNSFSSLRLPSYRYLMLNVPASARSDGLEATNSACREIDSSRSTPDRIGRLHEPLKLHRRRSNDRKERLRLTLILPTFNVWHAANTLR